MTTEQGQTVAVGSDDLLGWLHAKIADAERAVKTREDMAATWRSGDDASWARSAAMHPTTIGRSLKKSARLKEAETHDRIAARLRRDLGMYRAIAAAWSHSNK